MTADFDRFAGCKTLITGGAGFIGSHLARALLGVGAEVTIVDSLIPEYGGTLKNIADIEDQVTVNISDVRDPHGLPHLVRGVDYLFSLAGQTSHLDSMRDPFTDLDINVKAQLYILEACRMNNPHARIVFASTRQIYGRPQYLPVDEKHPLTPVDVNGVHKLAGESLHLVYRAVYGLPCGCLRLTNTYGPGMRVKDARQTFVGIWIKNVLTGQPILVYGDGEQRRDFTYVSDAVRAFLLAALSDDFPGHALNIGGSSPISLRDLAQLLTEINGQGDVQIVPFPEESKAIDIGDYWSDDRRARELLSWAPEISLEDGLAQTLDYYRVRSADYF